MNVRFVDCSPEEHKRYLFIMAIKALFSKNHNPCTYHNHGKINELAR